jgi:hypothetical protein
MLASGREVEKRYNSHDESRLRKENDDAACEITLSALMLSSHGALAVSYPLPPEGSRLVGSAFTIAVPDNNTQPLESFAAQYGQG